MAGTLAGTSFLDEILCEATGSPAHLQFKKEFEQRCSAEHVWLQPLSTRERRAMVHACHALRTQIKCFEDEFSLAAGHVPRGGERLPLASTHTLGVIFPRGSSVDDVLGTASIVNGSATSETTLHHAFNRWLASSNDQRKTRPRKRIGQPHFDMPQQ